MKTITQLIGITLLAVLLIHTVNAQPGSDEANSGIDPEFEAKATANGKWKHRLNHEKKTLKSMKKQFKKTSKHWSTLTLEQKLTAIRKLLDFIDQIKLVIVPRLSEYESQVQQDPTLTSKKKIKITKIIAYIEKKFKKLLIKIQKFLSDNIKELSLLDPSSKQRLEKAAADSQAQVKQTAAAASSKTSTKSAAQVSAPASAPVPVSAPVSAPVPTSAPVPASTSFSNPSSILGPAQSLAQPPTQPPTRSQLQVQPPSQLPAQPQLQGLQGIQAQAFIGVPGASMGSLSQMPFF